MKFIRYLFKDKLLLTSGSLIIGGTLIAIKFSKSKILKDENVYYNIKKDQLYFHSIQTKQLYLDEMKIIII
jgi:hypothetical protein